MIRATQRVLRIADRLGVEPELRQAHGRVQRLLEPDAKRRNRKDDENLLLLLASVLMPDSNCIDIGANVGTILAMMLSASPAGRHIAFEPLPSLCDGLRRRFPAVDIREVALSNRAGVDDFVHVTDLPSRSGLRRTYDKSATEILRTQVATLDSTLEPHYVPALIKIDVEGGEMHVLEGAKETIQRHGPIIVFEHDARWAAHYDTSSEDIFRLLSDEMQLRVFDMDGNGPYCASRFVAAVHGGERWNFFARR